MSKNLMRRALAIGVAACFVLIGAMSSAEAGRGGGFKGGGGHIGGSAFRGGNIHVGGGSVAKFHTNPGGKYVGGGSVAKFHTNPGGKYVGGGAGKFHTNPGGKYAYHGWSGKYDSHHNYGHYRRYGYYPWYGLPLYSAFDSGGVLACGQDAAAGGFERFLRQRDILFSVALEIGHLDLGDEKDWSGVLGAEPLDRGDPQPKRRQDG